LQQAALVLNASRRFRYTLDLKKEEQKEEVIRKIRAQAHVIRVFYCRVCFCLIWFMYADNIHFPFQAAYRFKEAARVGAQPKETAGTLSFFSYSPA
jgi:Ca2+-transporting ATPase